MHRFCVKFFESEDGATSIEYALIALLISTTIISTVTNIGTSLSGIFTNVNAGFVGK